MMWTAILKNTPLAVLVSLSTWLGSTAAMAHVGLNTEQLKTHLQIMDKIAKGSGGSRAMDTEGGTTTAAYIDDYLNLPNVTLIGLPFETASGQRGQNILVTVPGKLGTDIILIGAHYDSAQGQASLNDNASGVAVLLELIQHYAQPANTPKHSLMFVFWDGHHAGLAGSKALAAELPIAEMGTMHAYINVDQVGTQNPNVQIAGDPHKSANVYAKLEKQLAKFFTEKSIHIKPHPVLLTQSDLASLQGKMPVIGFSFTNATWSDPVRCQLQQCDQLSHIDINSMQLAADAIKYLIQHFE